MGGLHCVHHSPSVSILGPGTAPNGSIGSEHYCPYFIAEKAEAQKVQAIHKRLHSLELRLPTSEVGDGVGSMARVLGKVVLG